MTDDDGTGVVIVGAVGVEVLDVPVPDELAVAGVVVLVALGGVAAVVLEVVAAGVPLLLDVVADVMAVEGVGAVDVGVVVEAVGRVAVVVDVVVGTADVAVVVAAVVVAVAAVTAGVLVGSVAAVVVELAAGVLVEPLRPTVPAAVVVPTEAAADVLPAAVVVPAVLLSLDPHPASATSPPAMRSVTQIHFSADDRRDLFAKHEEFG